MGFKLPIISALLSVATISVFAVELSQTPAPVQTAIHAQVDDGVLGDIDQTNDGGETIFDVSYTTKAGDERDFSVADDGTLLSVEVTLEDVPDAVQKSIRSMVSGWQLEGVDKNVDDAEISYDVEVSKDGMERNYTFAENGSLSSMALSVTNAPAAVRKTIEAQIGDGQLKSLEESFDADGNSFDVEATTKDGGKKSFTVSANGTMLSEGVPLQKVVWLARRTIKEKIAGGKILQIDKSLVADEDGSMPYKVLGRKDGKPFDFSVGQKGKFLGMDD